MRALVAILSALVVVLAGFVGWQQWRILKTAEKMESAFDHLGELARKFEAHDRVLDIFAEAIDKANSDRAAMTAEVSRLRLQVLELDSLERKVSELEREVDSAKPGYIPPARFKGQTVP